MLIYIFTFIISTLFAYLAERNLEKGKRGKFILFSILCILLPSILSGVRALNIGTDTSGYIYLDFKYAHVASSFSKFLNIMEQEFLFLLINYIVASFSNSIHIALFIFQLLINTFLYMACVYNRKRCPIWLSYFCFLFLFFNKSMNMVRQSISLAILMFATRYIEEKKPFKYIFWILIATLFHSSSIIALLCYPISYFINLKSGFFYKTLIIGGIFVLLFAFQSLVSFMIFTLHILDEKYLFYIQSGRVDIELFMIVFKGVVLFVIFLFSKSLKKHDSFNNYLIFALVLDFLLFQMGNVYNYTQRFAYYFGYNQIFLLPQIYQIQKKRQGKLMSFVLVAGIVVSFFVLYYGIMGNDQTVPYMTNLFS